MNDPQGYDPPSEPNTGTERARPAGHASATTGGRKRKGNPLLWAILAAAIAFLIGFGWQYYRASTVQHALERTEQELAVERLRVSLAQATLAAQTGDYESARQEMSEFFSSAQSQLEETPPELRQTLVEILTRRDDVITGLSRSNPDYAGVLHGFLDRFRTAVAPEAQGVQPVGEMDTTG